MGSTLLSSINIGRETLISHGNAMATLADNVSNSNTTGFKSGSAEFADMLTGGAGAIGNMDSTLTGGDGSYIGRIKSNFTQGALEQTGKPYDLAVDGDGFFTVAKPDAAGNATSEFFYTRSGDFQLDSSGRLVNSSGYLVMSIPAGGTGTTLEPITLAGRDAVAVATTTAKLTGNLDAETEVNVRALPATFTSNSQISSFNPFTTSVRIIDSLGTSHDVGLSFFKTGISADGVTTWEARAFANGDQVQGGTAGEPAQVGASVVLNIGPDGIVQGAPTLSVPATWANGSAASNVAIDLSKFTGYATQSFISSAVSNGSVPGTATSIGFDSNGQINVVLDTGGTNPIGTLALATFPNDLGLERQGNTLFTATAAAGVVDYGAPRAKGRGALAQATLEVSNVDLADQFINVIRIQRTYQAGSQVIKTANDLLNNTLQIA